MSSLKQIRERKLLRKQGEIAKALGISQGHFANIELGKRKPSPALVIKLAKTFGMTTDEIWDCCKVVAS